MDPVLQDTAFSPWHPNLIALGIYAALVLVLLAILFFLSSWLGEKRPSADKALPYESGIIPTGSARLRYPVPFYLVAVFFLIFDVEGAFIFSYAAAWDKLGWTGWFQILFFIIMLLLGLIYIWNRGGLDWGPAKKKPTNS